MRSIVYIDGFNLYYGALRGGPNKWLDLQRYFELLRPGDDLQQIRYFTAPVVGQARQNQETYLRALETLRLVSTYLGKFKTKRVRCRVEGCGFEGVRRFPVPEEKRTDVNIAISMLDDAYRDACDRFVLVSGDSDLVPAIRILKRRFSSKEAIVYVPTRNSIRGAAVELRSIADKNRELPLTLLRKARLPSRLADGAGGWIVKPAGW